MSRRNEGKAIVSHAEANGDYIHTGNTEKVVIVADGPRVVHKGRYTLYETPTGGLHLVYQRDDKDTPDRFELPAAMVTLFNSAVSGNLSPTDMFRELMKMRGRT